jgi:hypothetical protein
MVGSVGEILEAPFRFEALHLQAVLSGLDRFPVAHVLFSHGPLVLGNGLESLAAATRCLGSAGRLTSVRRSRRGWCGSG